MKLAVQIVTGFILCFTGAAAVGQAQIGEPVDPEMILGPSDLQTIESSRTFNNVVLRDLPRDLQGNISLADFILTYANRSRHKLPVEALDEKSKILLAETEKQILAGEIDRAQHFWSKFVKSQKTSNSSVSLEDRIYELLKTYLDEKERELSRDIYDISTQGRTVQAQAEACRDEISEVRLEIRECEDFSNSDTPCTEKRLEHLHQRFDELHACLDNLRDLSFEVLINLRERLQEDDQTLKIMSAILKTLHDTAKNIISNTKG